MEGDGITAGGSGISLPDGTVGKLWMGVSATYLLTVLFPFVILDCLINYTLKPLQSDKHLGI